MPESTNLPDKHELAEERSDEQTASLEETDEQLEESSVTAEANANLREATPIQGFDLYVDPQDPNLGLYIRAGGALPDFANPKQWVFYRTTASDELSADLVQRIQADGHALQKLG